ncbi:MAG TPA: thiamine phosphate synthase [Vicinamibacterales bacterium]|nr:thiamine phosphate synthase [Vicinamibacterales bacterium]
MSNLPHIRPLLCLVTDRRRLSPGASETDAVDRLVAQVHSAARAGVSLVQIRERGLSDAVLYHLATRCVDAVAGTSCRVLVNDRPDVAIACGAHGVHLRADSYDARLVRQFTPQRFIIGRSVHRAEEAAEIRRENSVDYVLFGTVFPSASKSAGSPVAGIEGLAAAVRSASPVPVIAIGGMTPEHAAEAARAGAAGIAGIGLFLTCDAAELRRTAAAVRQAFVDSSSVHH